MWSDMKDPGYLTSHVWKIWKSRIVFYAFTFDDIVVLAWLERFLFGADEYSLTFEAFIFSTSAQKVSKVSFVSLKQLISVSFR